MIDITVDWFYLQGIEKGEHQKTLEFCVSLIQTSDFDDHRIARLIGLDIEIVQSIRAIVVSHPDNFRELVMNLFLEKK